MNQSLMRVPLCPGTVLLIFVYTTRRGKNMTTREILEYLLAMQSHEIPPVSTAGLFQALDALQSDGVTENG